MKRKIKFLSILLVLLLSFSFNTKVVYADEIVYLGGMPAGFSLFTRGAEIVSVCDVITEKGLVSPAKEIGLKEGDILLKINQNDINNADDIKINLDGGEVVLQYKREGQNMIKTIIPAKDINGNYKLGVLVKDNVSGIGTITFIKGDRFASLGHPVVDTNGNSVEICGGELYNCTLTSCVKGERGKAGELRGTFEKIKSVGTIDKNHITGVYGKLNQNFDKNCLSKVSIGSATMGDAYIYTSIDNSSPKMYRISIIKIDETFETKNFVVKINDKELLEKTGGIVQGMSGSPIIQNDKLVGAITHVFINDPTRGFGIDVKNMINN